MDLTSFAQAAILSGTAVTLTTEILKSKYIPIPVTSHKRLTAAILSVLTSLYSVYQYNASHVVALDLRSATALALLTLLVAAMTYDHIIKGA